jgi:hypothetical protein
MERLLRRFSDALERADVALAFYAGHGLQVHGRNYLVPVDAKLEKENDLRFDAVSLDDLQQLMETSQRINILILDACRDNPLARNLARSMGTRSNGIGRGLGQTQAGIGTLIVYATQPGNVALDGEGRNSPFTAALLANVETPGLEVRQVFTRVRQAVIQTTKGKQVPWDSSSLTGDWFFAAASAPGQTPPATVTPPPPPQAPRADRSADQETVFWQSIKDSKNAADFKAYLARFPQGTFAELAKIRLAEIEKAAAVTPPSAPEKPAPLSPAPSKPQRTSTFEAGLAVNHRTDQFMLYRGSGPSCMGSKLTVTAQECRDDCLANRKCVAWISRIPGGYGCENYPDKRGCMLLSGFESRRTISGYIGGIIRTTPAAAPAPAQPPKPPAQTRRTSTFESDVVAVAGPGGSMDAKWGISTAQECQAICIANPRCIAWHYTDSEHLGVRRRCIQYGGKADRVKPTTPGIFISGFIRIGPAQ